MKKIIVIFMMVFELLSFININAFANRSDKYITKEISDLKMYFKDDSFVVSWNDININKVDIQIADSHTLQVIAKETVSGGYLETPIPETVEEIIVDITPSTSANVKGAGEQFVYEVNNHPLATVNFDEIEYTNKETYHAIVELKDEYGLLLMDNGEEVGSANISPAGLYDIEVPIAEGDNEVLVYVIDKNGNMRSTSGSVIKDTVPPTIKIVNDIEGIQTYDENIVFKGVVEDYYSLVFHNEEVPVEWDGSFEITCDLKEGTNELSLTAYDLAGNYTTYTAYITRLVKEPFRFPWGIAVAIIIAGVIICFFLLLKRKNANFKEQILDELSNLKNKKGDKLKQKKEMTSADITSWIYCGLILLVTYILINHVFLITYVASGSMEPTLMTGGNCIMNRLAYVNSEPQRGDIVSFYSRENKSNFTKRIIGIPNDEISFIDGYVCINGQICNESYIPEDVETNSTYTFKVPDNCYFVMGDNREFSSDSRHWENPYISKDDIVARNIFYTDIVLQIKRLFLH